MKVIFLDVDGVLNSERSFLAGQRRLREYEDSGEHQNDPYWLKITTCTIDYVACDLINRICNTFNAKIVVSSTHRKHFRDGPQKLEQLKNYFTTLGVHSEYIIDWTVTMNTLRGTEIQEWLNRHPEVTHYVIIDDSSDMLESQKEFFVHTDPAIGLSAEDYRKVTRLFGREDSGLILF